MNLRLICENLTETTNAFYIFSMVSVTPSKRSASRGYPSTPLRVNVPYVKVQLRAHLIAEKGFMHRCIGASMAALCIMVSICATADAFSTSPNRVEIAIAAGERYEGSFTVKNPTPNAVSMKVVVEDWSSDHDGRQVLKGEQEALGWLEFTPRAFELAPQGFQAVKYTVSLPPDAKGEYTAMVYFGTAPEPSASGISIINRVGNALYVVVKGTEIVKGKINAVRVTRARPAKEEVVIENLGNIHMRPKGRVIIKRKGLIVFDKKARQPLEMTVNEAGFPVLAHQEYVFEAWSKEELRPGNYSLEVNMEFGKEVYRDTLEFRVGPKGEVTNLALKG